MLKRIKTDTPGFDEMIDKVFAKFDHNKDGVLSMDEFDVLVEEVGAYFSELVQKSGGRWIPLLRRVKLGIRPRNGTRRRGWMGVAVD